MTPPAASDKKDHYYVASVAELDRADIALRLQFHLKREYLKLGSSPDEWTDTEQLPHSKQRMVSQISYSLVGRDPDSEVDMDLGVSVKPLYKSYMKEKYVDIIYPIRDFSNVLIIGSKSKLLALTERFGKHPLLIKHINTLHVNYPDVANP